MEHVQYNARGRGPSSLTSSKRGLAGDGASQLLLGADPRCPCAQMTADMLAALTAHSGASHVVLEFPHWLFVPVPSILYRILQTTVRSALPVTISPRTA